MSTKDRIMEASFKLFLKKGLDNVSVSEIKEAGKITSGGFYHYFESKEKLIVEVEKKYILQHYSDAVKAIKAKKGTLIDKIWMIADYTIGYDSINKKVKDSHDHIDKETYFLYLDCIRRGGNTSVVLRDFNLELIDAYTDMFEEAKNSGELSSDYDSRELGMLFATILNGSVYLSSFLPSPDLKKLFDDNINIFLEKINK